MLIFQKVTEMPSDSGRVVGLCSYQDRVIIACEYGIWEMVDDGYHNHSLRKLHVDRIEELERAASAAGTTHE